MKICENYDELPNGLKKFLESEANIFFSKSYENNVIYRKQKLYYVWSENNIWVLRIKQELFLKAAIIESEPYTYGISKENMKDFMNKAMGILKKKGVQWTICATTARLQDYPEGGLVVPTGNFIINLFNDEDILWKNMHSKHRNSIRRGEKAGVKIIIGGKELISEYVPLANETYERSGIAGNSVTYYNGLIERLEDNVVLMLAYKDKEIQAGGMFYYNKKIAYYLHGASIRRPEPGATNYLLWKAMLYFKSIGVKEFSFVGYHFDPEPGSKLEGIQRFKERFGGTLERSYSFRYEQNSIAYKIYCLAMQLKSKTPFVKFEDAIDKQIDKYPELNGGN